MNVIEKGVDLLETSENRRPSGLSYLSLSLRELLLLIVIAALVIMYFLPRKQVPRYNSNASFQLSAPIEYRYWQQRGNSGTGTGRIRSGNEWRPANGIEVFENFVILHLDDGVDKMIEREGLQWFDWRRVQRSTDSGAADPKSGH